MNTDLELLQFFRKKLSQLIPYPFKVGVIRGKYVLDISIHKQLALRIEIGDLTNRTVWDIIVEIEAAVKQYTKKTELPSPDKRPLI